MSDENGDKPPPPESTKSADDTAVKQEDEAPPPAAPTEGGEETAEVTEGTEANDGESADDETAPELTDPVEEDTTEESESEESESEDEAESETDETTDESAETQVEGGEQQTLSPNLERHVFEGEIDENGDLTGYHHREGGTDQGEAKLVWRENAADVDGVYKGKWTMDGRTDVKGSTFFPDSYTQDDVRGAIREAWENRTPTGVDNQWKGVTSGGITVRGYVNGDRSIQDSTEDDITTAYPIRKARR